MRILWITNIIFPAPGKILGMSDFYGGGWIQSLAKHITSSGDIKLCIATVYRDNKIQLFDIEGIQYYMLPVNSYSKYQKNLESYWKQVCSEFKPDIIHIHGTERLHGLACMRACLNMKYIISLQGLISVIDRYYLGGLSHLEILKNITLRDIISRDSLFQAKRKMAIGGIFEKEYLNRTKHVIGRTSWDYSHSKVLNPSITYHFCNECLRDGFYSSGVWDISNISRHSLFLSQGYYPIKGLHKAIMAVAIVKKEFPDVRLRIAGFDVLRNKSLAENLRLSGYGSYIRRLIKKNNLEGNVFFSGDLNEENMIKEYKSAHIFICPSSIENSSNSIGEAQMLGTPVIASYVGGNPDMIIHDFSGVLYRFEEVEMLAYNIKRLFNDDNLAVRLSGNSRSVALVRHERTQISANVISIYDDIL